MTLMTATSVATICIVLAMGGASLFREIGYVFDERRRNRRKDHRGGRRQADHAPVPA